jgi:hypothetical protein
MSKLPVACLLGNSFLYPHEVNVLMSSTIGPALQYKHYLFLIYVVPHKRARPIRAAQPTVLCKGRISYIETTCSLDALRMN